MKKIAYTALCAIICSLLSGCTTTGDKGEPLESRIKNLEDREEIRQLLMDYGRFLDQRDFASFSSLFAEEEGVWSGGMGEAKGSKAICTLMEETIGKSTDINTTPNYHLFMNEVIHVNGDEADATSKWIFVVQGEKGGPQPFFLGHYEDSFIRENGRWKFLKRVVHADIPSEKTISKK